VTCGRPAERNDRNRIGVIRIALAPRGRGQQPHPGGKVGLHIHHAFVGAASHADPRTTMRYDRARASLDRHATYIVAAYLAGAAR
jgi:hypothetical protein